MDDRIEVLLYCVKGNRERREGGEIHDSARNCEAERAAQIPHEAVDRSVAGTAKQEGIHTF
jgi:hypothetical protein